MSRSRLSFAGIESHISRPILPALRKIIRFGKAASARNTTSLTESLLASDLRQKHFSQSSGAMHVVQVANFAPEQSPSPLNSSSG